MKWEPLPIAGGAYTDDTTPWTAQDCLNYLVVMAERNGTRSPVKIQQCPGAAVFTTLQDAPVRAMHNAEGLLASVCGTGFYTISAQGEITLRGSIPGVSRCSIAHNQVTGGNEIAIANGLSGYLFNTKTNTLAQITDAGFPGAKVFDFVDGYFVYVEPAGRFWGWSDLAQGGEYNTIDRSEAESQPDRIVTLKVSHREVVVFGERTVEFFRNTGAGTGTFQRIDGTEMEIGCPSTFGVAKIDNSLVFVGHDGSAYRLDGYTPVRISTHAIEQAWGRCNLADCYTFTYEDQGHKIVYFTFPDGYTWGYDVATDQWHRRASKNLDFWRMTDAVQWKIGAFNGWVTGDYANGQLYFLDWNLSTEGGEVMERRMRLHVIHDNENRFQMHALKLVFDTGKTSESFPPPTQWPEPPAVVDPLTITGNLPDGAVGDSGTMPYIVTGGTPPYNVVLHSGAFPTGAAMDLDGLVTYEYEEVGFWSWVPKVIDSMGRTATITDTALVGGSIFNWFVQDGLAATQSMTVFIDGDVIAVGQDNSVVAYSLDRAATDFVAVAMPASMDVSGLVKFGGFWYAFGRGSGTNRAARAPGDTFAFALLANPSFLIPGNGHSAFVIDGAMYVSQACDTGQNFRLQRTTDGVAFTAVDTGIAGAINGSIVSHCKTSDGWHVFGTSNGKVLRSDDLETFAVVATLASGAVSVAALGTTVLVANEADTLVRRSTDSGATFGTPYVLASKVLANGQHFIGAHSDVVWTSPDGVDIASWTERLDAGSLGSGTQSQGYATADLAAFGTFASYAYVGDVS